MDKRHREELDQNDLQAALTNFGGWWEKWGLHASALVLVVLGIYCARAWYTASQSRAQQDLLQNLEGSTSPDSLREVGVSAANKPAIAALAYLRGADLALAKATQPASAQPPATQPGDAASPEPLAPEGRTRLLEDAASMYQEVIESPDAPLLLKLNAKLGLAAVHESRAEWGDAGKLYQEVIDGAGDNQLLKAEAQGHLAILDRLALAVPFAPEPMPATMPALSNVLHDMAASPTTKPARANGSP